MCVDGCQRVAYMVRMVGFRRREMQSNSSTHTHRVRMVEAEIRRAGTMREVTISYADGHVGNYPTIASAADAVGVDDNTLLRMATGTSRAMAARGIVRVSVAPNGGKAVAKPPKSGRPLRYDRPVGAETMAEIYRQARQYVGRALGIPREERRDMVQVIASKVAADVSSGKRDATRYQMAMWLRLRVRHHGCKELRRWSRREARLEHADGDALERLAGAAVASDEGRLLADVPADLRELARLMLAGLSRQEIDAALGVGDATRAEMARKLGEWLRGTPPP